MDTPSWERGRGRSFHVSFSVWLFYRELMHKVPRVVICGGSFSHQIKCTKSSAAVGTVHNRQTFLPESGMSRLLIGLTAARWPKPLSAFTVCLSRADKPLSESGVSRLLIGLTAARWPKPLFISIVYPSHWVVLLCLRVTD